MNCDILLYPFCLWFRSFVQSHRNSFAMIHYDWICLRCVFVTSHSVTTVNVLPKSLTTLSRGFSLSLLLPVQTEDIFIHSNPVHEPPSSHIYLSNCHSHSVWKLTSYTHKTGKAIIRKYTVHYLVSGLPKHHSDYYCTIENITTAKLSALNIVKIFRLWPYFL